MNAYQENVTMYIHVGPDLDHHMPFNILTVNSVFKSS